MKRWRMLSVIRVNRSPQAVLLSTRNSKDLIRSGVPLPLLGFREPMRLLCFWCCLRARLISDATERGCFRCQVSLSNSTWTLFLTLTSTQSQKQITRSHVHCARATWCDDRIVTDSGWLFLNTPPVFLYKLFIIYTPVFLSICHTTVFLYRLVFFFSLSLLTLSLHAKVFLCAPESFSVILLLCSREHYGLPVNTEPPQGKKTPDCGGLLMHSCILSWGNSYVKPDRPEAGYTTATTDACNP